MTPGLEERLLGNYRELVRVLDANGYRSDLLINRFLFLPVRAPEGKIPGYFLALRESYQSPDRVERMFFWKAATAEEAVLNVRSYPLREDDFERQLRQLHSDKDYKKARRLLALFTGLGMLAFANKVCNVNWPIDALFSTMASVVSAMAAYRMFVPVTDAFQWA